MYMYKPIANTVKTLFIEHKNYEYPGIKLNLLVILAQKSLCARKIHHISVHAWATTATWTQEARHIAWVWVGISKAVASIITSH